jgi:DNA-binding NtrC family response regulator
LDTSKSKRTVLLAFKDDSDTEQLRQILSVKNCRIIKAGNFLSLIDSLEHYRIQLMIAEEYLVDIAMTAFLPFLRKRYPEIEVIILMKEYSPRMEIKLRQFKLFCLLQRPVRHDLLSSVVAKAFQKYKHGLIPA